MREGRLASLGRHCNRTEPADDLPAESALGLITFCLPKSTLGLGLGSVWSLPGTRKAPGSVSSTTEGKRKRKKSTGLQRLAVASASLGETQS